MDWLPHITPFIPWLIAHPKVQTLVPKQFHDILIANGVNESQLVHTMAVLAKANSLHVGVFQGLPGGKGPSGQLCASCCASCWRNVGLIANMQEQLLPKYIQKANTQAQKRQCHIQYLGCFANDFGERRINATETNAGTGEARVMSAGACARLAATRSHSWIGLEHPSSRLEREGSAECITLQSQTNHSLKRALDRECWSRVDGFGRPLGGAFRVAAYNVKMDDVGGCLASRPPAIIYVARPTCSLPKCRSVVNEDNIVTAIWNQMVEQGLASTMEFVVFKPEVFREQQDLMYQASLFNRARMVWGAHGGGLTNMVFAQANCRTAFIEVSTMYNFVSWGASEQSLDFNFGAHCVVRW
jgi:hypothetical protein